jgi:hypothetical protein
METNKQDLFEAKKKLEEAEEALKTFQEDDSRGKLLTRLREQLLTVWKTLEEREKGLEEKEKSWRETVQDLLRKLPPAQPGNDFVTRRWGGGERRERLANNVRHPSLFNMPTWYDGSLNSVQIHFEERASTSWRRDRQ